MNYSKIVLDICNRIGVVFPPDSLLNWMKNEIVNVSYEIFSITELSKSIYKYSVTSENSSVELPPDFYVPQEVVMKDSDGVDLKIRELQYEQFIKNYSDNAVVYTISNIDGISKLEWKPSFDGTIILYYVSTPVPIRIFLDDAPMLSPVFYECIADGVALRWLKQEYIKASTQEEIFKFNNLISIYEKDFDIKKQRIISYSKKTSSTQQIQNWDFLNDKNMIIV